MEPFDPPSPTTTLGKLKQGFDFLVTDFAFVSLIAKEVDHLRANHYLVYMHEKSNVQIEICADEGWFHAVIRRLIKGVPADYHDKANCIGFEELAIWESGNTYDHFDYFTGGKIGLQGVIENTAKLFKRNKEILTTDVWLDTEEIQRLRDKKFEATFGHIPDRNSPTFFSRLKKAFSQYLHTQGFTLTLDSDLLSPFDPDSVANKLIFEKEQTVIEIIENDWKDDCFGYKIYKNRERIGNIDLANTDKDKALALAMDAIQAHV